MLPIFSGFAWSEKPGLESGRVIVRTSEASPGTLRRPELVLMEHYLPIHLLIVCIHYHLDVPPQWAELSLETASIFSWCLAQRAGQTTAAAPPEKGGVELCRILEALQSGG